MDKEDIIGLSLAYLSIPIFWMIVFGIIPIKHLITLGSFLLIAVIFINMVKK